jgi:hypothetical protein
MGGQIQQKNRSTKWGVDEMGGLQDVGRQDGLFSIVDEVSVDEMSVDKVSVDEVRSYLDVIITIFCNFCQFSAKKNGVFSQNLML